MRQTNSTRWHFRSSLGEHCQNELLQGLEWVLKGDKKDDDGLKMSGQVLLDRFVEWYQSHKDEIRKSL
jgi:hypothetical protein